VEDRIKEALDSILVCDKPVGVLVSGGADSALLLYLLLSKYKSKVHIFSLDIGKQRGVDIVHNIDVIRRCIQLTGNYNVEQHINYTGGFNLGETFALAEEYVNDGRIHYLFTGITKNPPVEVQDTWPKKLPVSTQLTDIRSNREPDEYRDPFRHSEDRKIYPWTNLDKQDIAYLYREYDLIESIFPYTRSCINNDVGDVHCGECWWCGERRWGFGTL